MGRYLCDCVDDCALYLANELRSASFDEYLRVAKGNTGIASILYLFIKGEDMLGDDRKKYMTYLCTFAWVNRQYADYIFPFYWMTQDHGGLHELVSEDVAYLVLSYAESLGLMEHGSAIRCSWLCHDSATDLIDRNLAETILTNLQRCTSLYRNLGANSASDPTWLIAHTADKNAEFWNVIFSHTLKKIKERKTTDTTCENQPSLPPPSEDHHIYLDVDDIRALTAAGYLFKDCSSLASTEFFMVPN